MSEKDRSQFARKHPADAKVDPALSTALLKRTIDGELPCAVGFEVAKSLEMPAEEVGRAADLLELPLVKCQLGLFGYRPEKKIVKPAGTMAPDLKEAILAGLENDRLPCKTAWEVADRLGIRKMRVSAACEAMKIKIKPCQLGAF